MSTKYQSDTDFKMVLWQLAFQFKSSIRQVLRDSELDLNGMHLRLLHAIGHHPNGTANQLASWSGRNKGQITRLVNELEAKGLVTRQPHPEDKRSQLLNLSNDGIKLMAKTNQVEKEVEARLLAGLQADEIEIFLTLAKRMLVNLNNT